MFQGKKNRWISEWNVLQNFQYYHKNLCFVFIVKNDVTCRRHMRNYVFLKVLCTSICVTLWFFINIRSFSSLLTLIFMNEWKLKILIYAGFSQVCVKMNDFLSIQLYNDTKQFKRFTNKSEDGSHTTHKTT